MRLNLVNKETAPTPPFVYELVDYIPEYTPFILFSLWLKSQRYFWASSDDWKVARSALAEQGAYLLMPIGMDLINAVDRVYTLLDVRLAGIERTTTGLGVTGDPFVYDPPLYQTPEIFDDVDASLIGLATNTKRAWKNLLNGTTSTDYGDDRNFRQQLEDLITSVAASDDLDDDILAKLVEIAALLA